MSRCLRKEGMVKEDAGSARTQEAERRGKKKRRKKKKKKGGKEKMRDDEDKQEPELVGADLPEGVPPAATDTGRQRSESEAAQAEEDAVRLRLPPRAHFPELAPRGTNAAASSKPAPG